MKKLIVLFCFLMISSFVFSQDVSKKVIKLGLLPVKCWIVKGDSLIPYDILSAEIIQDQKVYNIKEVVFFTTDLRIVIRGKLERLVVFQP